MGAAENLPWSKQEFEAATARQGQALPHLSSVPHRNEQRASAPGNRCRAGYTTASTTRSAFRSRTRRCLSNMPDRDQRRQWIQRIIDHDGVEGEEGGIEAWLRLAEACGPRREEVTSLKHVLPGVRFAVDAYVNFARRAPWQEAACSSLTELFAPEIHQKRLDNWPQHYPWIEAGGLRLLPQAPVGSAPRRRAWPAASRWIISRPAREQERALEILQFKLDVLWSMLDAMQINYGIGEPRSHV